MTTFVQLYVTGKINSKRDTSSLNELLVELQTNGAAIRNVTLAATSNSRDNFGHEAVYLITYEADSEIDV